MPRPPLRSAARAGAALTGLAALLLLVAPSAQAAPARLMLVTCAPGFPGTTAEAQPAMDALAAALAHAAALPEGRLGALYLPGEAEGVARLGEPDAAVALLALPFFLEHAGPLGLTARLQVEVAGTGALERWTLVAKKGRVGKPADLAGFTVLSTAGYAPAFVRGALGAWGRLPATAAVAPTSQLLSALRQAAGGADLALLLDGAQAAALASLPFAAELEVVARSAPLPGSVVATVGKRLPPARWTQLEQAFLRLHADPAGAAALAGVRMVRFVPLDQPALAAARALVAGGAR
jgi:hypothetical protein